LNYYRFFLANKNPAFWSFADLLFGFGQTFVLSLIFQVLSMNLTVSVNPLFSFIYASATMCSGLTIVFAGKIIDRVSIKKFSIVVIIGMIAANVVVGLSMNLVMLFVAFFMLRFFGQGLLSHTAMTSMGRYFSHARGKALSIAQLGYPLAEAIFPISIISLIIAFGWRESFLASSIFISITLIPLVWYLLRNFDKSKIREEPVKLKNTNGLQANDSKVWKQKEIVRDIHFYLFAPTVFIVGFTLTSLFFYQTFIAQFKGWSLEWMALSITAYALASFSSSIITRCIDR
jgi:MFS family permease